MTYIDITYEMDIDGEPMEIEATVQLETETYHHEGYTDGRGRGKVTDIVGATLVAANVGPLAYSRTGLVDFIGIDTVTAIESLAIEQGEK